MLLAKVTGKKHGAENQAVRMDLRADTFDQFRTHPSSSNENAQELHVMATRPRQPVEEFPTREAKPLTPDSLERRIGKLSFENGFPSEETTRKLFDEMDYQRAVQAYLWAYPAVSFESIRIGTKRDLGTDLRSR
jgi:hypothetical protein